MLSLLFATAFAVDVCVEGACPGPLAVQASGLPARANFTVMTSASAGSGVVLGGPCAGTVTGLSSPAVAATGRADAEGVGAVFPNVSAGACGLVQVLDLTTCDVSPVTAAGGDCGGATWGVIPTTYEDFDVADDGFTVAVGYAGGDVTLDCFNPDGSAMVSNLAVGTYGSYPMSAVYVSDVSNHVLVTWRDYDPALETLRYAYLDETCTPLVVDGELLAGAYFEFHEAAMDDDGNAVVAVSDGETWVTWLDDTGDVVHTEVAFDIGASYGTHVALERDGQFGIVGAQIHSGDGIYVRRFEGPGAWVEPAPVRIPVGYHYWYDGFTLGMNDEREWVLLWRSDGDQIEARFFDSLSAPVAWVRRPTLDFEGWAGGHSYDSFRTRHQEIPLRGSNFILGEVYNWIAGTNVSVRHWEYTPGGVLVEQSRTSLSLPEGLTVRMDGEGNAYVRDGSGLYDLGYWP